MKESGSWNSSYRNSRAIRSSGGTFSRCSLVKRYSLTFLGDYSSLWDFTSPEPSPLPLLNFRREMGCWYPKLTIITPILCLKIGSTCYSRSLKNRENGYRRSKFQTQSPAIKIRYLSCSTRRSRIIQGGRRWLRLTKLEGSLTTFDAIILNIFITKKVMSFEIQHKTQNQIGVGFGILANRRLWWLVNF